MVKLLPPDFETAPGLRNEKGIAPAYKLLPGGVQQVGLMASSFLTAMQGGVPRKRENYLMHAACLVCCAYENRHGKFDPRGREFIVGRLQLVPVVQSGEVARFANCMDGLYGDRYNDIPFEWTLEQTLVHIAVVSALRVDCTKELFVSPADGATKAFALSTLKFVKVDWDKLKETA